MTWVELLSASAWKGAAILIAAFAAAAALGRASAAVRHFVWTAAFAALLALPVAMLLAPRWEALSPAVTAMVVRPGPAAASVPPAAQAAGAPLNWPLILWLLGSAAAASRFVVGTARTWWLVRRAGELPGRRAEVADLRRALGIRRPVRVLASAAAPMPLAWGIARPVVLLPENAVDWPQARLGAVLLHELVHIQRLDLVAQTVAQAACCLFWFNPLVWMAARRLRREREQACDDAVLLGGVAAPEYAGHLMDLARALAARHWPRADALTMADSSDLETRIRALLDRGRNRRPLSRRAALAVACAVVVVLLPVAAITAHAQASRGSLAGVVEDPSGARVPGCQVTAKNLDGANQEVTRANAAGEYRFYAIPPGRYALEFASPGFSRAKVEAAIAAGQTARVDASLEIGAALEQMTVRGTRPGSTPVAVNPTPQRVRVGGNVVPMKLVRQVRPHYPDELKQLGVEGTVMVRAVVSKDGTVTSPEVINTDVDARLAKIALETVVQWSYQPTLLNGQPVETTTTIRLDFLLGQ